jgi:hypothetical protein
MDTVLLLLLIIFVGGVGVHPSHHPARLAAGAHRPQVSPESRERAWLLLGMFESRKARGSPRGTRKDGTVSFRDSEVARPGPVG